jgi:hypothetical protein
MPQRGGFEYDPVEDTPEYKAVIKEVAALTERELNGRRGLGTCHYYWSIKKRLLAERGITWRSPAEMNPGVLFD